MTTEDFISELFYRVDEAMTDIPKHPLANLWPSEIVTVGDSLCAQRGRESGLLSVVDPGLAEIVSRAARADALVSPLGHPPDLDRRVPGYARRSWGRVSKTGQLGLIFLARNLGAKLPYSIDGVLLIPRHIAWPLGPLLEFFLSPNPATLIAPLPRCWMVFSVMEMAHAVMLVLELTKPAASP